ncbi:glycosyltransferase [Nonlabens antarcticus]|uniref:glycosyltransferase n=1 Tax=Nonlabens antarcticus TaxID=392714 RepID=UPI00189147AD|nr:glycosyltransferase [Nonlabens antarcticus]
MKILFVSMNNIHFRRWSDQLRDSGHEVFWFDILDQGYAPSMDWMNQITGWKKGFLKRKGRSFLKRFFPILYRSLETRFDIPVDVAFAKALQDTQPDLVHSFALQIGCLPIYPILKEYPEVNWLYSSWGTDLFKPQLIGVSNQKLRLILERVDYLLVDNYRDFRIANDMEFRNKFLGVFPGNGGTDFSDTIIESKNKVGILIKANQDVVGRGDLIAQSIFNLKEQLTDIPIYFVGASNLKLYDQLGQWPMVSIFKRSELLDQPELKEIYSKCFLYVAISLSDGTPNMLIEALGNGLYAIQSNPGDALNELIVEDISGNLLPTNVCQGRLEEVIINAIQKKYEIIDEIHEESKRIQEKYDTSNWTLLIHNLYNDIEKGNT